MAGKGVLERMLEAIGRAWAALMGKLEDRKETKPVKPDPERRETAQPAEATASRYDAMASKDPVHGLYMRAFSAVGGKEAAETSKRGADAFINGEFRKGYSLSFDATVMAAKHVGHEALAAAKAIKQEVQSAITGGEEVTERSAAPATPTGSATAPKTVSER